MKIQFPTTRRGVAGTASRQRGFSMIEVLITLVVLAVGLLGLALLQTTNLRYTQSANLRTKAVNLGTELLDTMRANHTEVAAYDAALNGDPMPAGALSDALDGCELGGTMTSAANMARWQCEVVEALGPQATADVLPTADGVQVIVAWDDEFWLPTADKTVGSGAITLSSQL